MPISWLLKRACFPTLHCLQSIAASLAVCHHKFELIAESCFICVLLNGSSAYLLVTNGPRFEETCKSLRLQISLGNMYSRLNHAVVSYSKWQGTSNLFISVYCVFANLWIALAWQRYELDDGVGCTKASDSHGPVFAASLA